MGETGQKTPGTEFWSLAAISIPNASTLKPAPKCSFFVAKIKLAMRLFFFTCMKTIICHFILKMSWEL